MSKHRNLSSKFSVVYDFSLDQDSDLDIAAINFALYVAEKLERDVEIKRDATGWYHIYGPLFNLDNPPFYGKRVLFNIIAPSKSGPQIQFLGSYAGEITQILSTKFDKYLGNVLSWKFKSDLDKYLAGVKIFESGS